MEEQIKTAEIKSESMTHVARRCGGGRIKVTASCPPAHFDGIRRRRSPDSFGPDQETKRICGCPEHTGLSTGWKRLLCIFVRISYRQIFSSIGPVAS